MPRTRSLAWAELKVGLVTMFAILMTGVLIFQLSGQGGFPWQQYPLKAVFVDTPGLKEGAPVRLAGLEVGAVEKLDFAPGSDSIEVTMKLRKDVQARVTTTSVASLGSVSLLGEAAVDITASTRGEPLPEWGYVQTGRSAGSLTDVAARAATGIEEAKALLQDIRAGRGTVGQLFTNDSLYQDLGRLLNAVEDVAQGLNEGRGTLGRLLTNPAAARSLETAMSNLADMSARIRAGEGSIGRLLADETLARTLTSASTNVDEISGRVNRGEGTLGQLTVNREPFDRLNALSKRLDEVADGLQKGQGTAGQLLQDKQLYENMNTTFVELQTTVAEVRQLVAAIRADPKKYLNIRVSLF